MYSNSVDMSLLFSPIYKCEEGELRKSTELMGPNFHHHQQQQQHHQPQQQQSSGLMRYRSAPSSLLESLVGGSNGGCDDFRYLRSSSPEVDAILEKFMSSCNGSGDSISQDLHEFGGKAMKQEALDSIPPQNGYSNGSQMVYQTPQAHELQQQNLTTAGTNMECSYDGMSSRVEVEMGTRNCSNLIRQSSSPAGLFSNLDVENGMASTSRMNNYMNFSNVSPSSSRLLPQISEMGNENMGINSPEYQRKVGVDNGNKRSYLASFLDDSWQTSSFNGLKRAREDNGNMYMGLNSLDTQNGNTGSRTTTLAHQYSLPNTSAERAAIDKFLQFQGSVPCKIRAKRGFATHPRSIAERMRRTRISDRMKKLQDLFPNMDKQTNTADMLDLAVEYIKDLQKHVKTLSDTKAKCTCSSKPKQYSNR